jgi:16S rRNA processing protein RimM
MARTAPSDAGLITVGRIVAPHGLQGEVRVRLETDFPERFAARRAVFLVRDGRAEPTTITAARPHRAGMLVSIAGVEDATAAGQLRGAAIAVPRASLAPLDEDSFYVFQLIGLRACTTDGEDLGVVGEVMRGPAHDIYVVRGRDGEVLLPAVRQVVRGVDLAAGVITVELPVGLRLSSPGA